MTVYIINILAALIVCNIAESRSRQYDISIEDSVFVKRGMSFILIVWTLLYGLRFHVGADSWSFYDSFMRYLVNGNSSFLAFVSERRDIVFSAVEFFCYKAFNGSWIWYQIVLGLITYLPIVYVIRKKSDDLTFTVLLYIFTLSFYEGYNITRQAISVGFSFYAYHICLKEKKWIRYSIIMLLAVGIHPGALITIPLHFVSQRWDKISKHIVVIIVMLIGLISLDSIWGSVLSVLYFFGQDKIAQDYSILSNNTTNITRIIVIVLPALLCCIRHRNIELEYPESKPDLILMLYGATFALYGLRNVIFVRVAGYFLINIVLMLPRYVRTTVNNNKQMRFLILVLYFAYMFLLLLSGEGHYYPYHWVWEFPYVT